MEGGGELRQTEFVEKRFSSDNGSFARTASTPEFKIYRYVLKCKIDVRSEVTAVFLGQWTQYGNM